MILAVTLLAPAAAVAQPTRQVPVDSLIYDLRNPDPVRRREAVVAHRPEQGAARGPGRRRHRRRSGCVGPPRHRRDAAGARRHPRAARPGRADQRPREGHPRVGRHRRDPALPAPRERHRPVADAGRQLLQPQRGRMGRRGHRARSRRRPDGGAGAAGAPPGPERQHPHQGGPLPRHPARPRRGADAGPRDEGGPQPERALRGDPGPRQDRRHRGRQGRAAVHALDRIEAADGGGADRRPPARPGRAARADPAVHEGSGAAEAPGGRPVPRRADGGDRADRRPVLEGAVHAPARPR